MPFVAFGANTDYFGLAGTDLKLKASSKTAVPKTRKDANDAKNDIAASSFTGLTTLYDIECTYLLKSGTLDLSTIKLGLVAVGEVDTLFLAVNVVTGNGQWPEIKVTGKLGFLLEEIAGEFYTWTLPAVTLVGRKMAQEIGFTTGSGCSLTGTTADFEIELGEATVNGVQVAHDLSGGTKKVQATFQTVTATPSWTVTTPGIGLTETQAPGADEPDGEYVTATASAEGTLTRDAA